MELSKRLQAVADLVTPGGIVADIGTDHGYIPIWLVESKKNPGAIAMDINKGPLAAAKAHILEYGLSDYIETRLSDGVMALKPGEADSIVIAGMGGALVIKILTEGRDVLDAVGECILQPQSELFKVRKFLQENGYRITEEDMVFEDGKYYPMMKVIKGPDEDYGKLELLYGRKLLCSCHPVLLQYLEWEISVKEKVLSELEKAEGEKSRRREEEIEAELAEARRALEMMRG